MLPSSSLQVEHLNSGRACLPNVAKERSAQGSRPGFTNLLAPSGKSSIDFAGEKQNRSWLWSGKAVRPQNPRGLCANPPGFAIAFYRW
jgi:hypothetical protein